MQIQISWHLKKPTDLDLHCLQRQGISGFSRTRAKAPSRFVVDNILKNFFFLFFSFFIENRSGNFMCLADASDEISKLIFYEKKK